MIYRTYHIKGMAYIYIYIYTVGREILDSLIFHILNLRLVWI